MRISICIPNFNAQAYIGPCLESVLAQGWADLEVIVCDNSSSDNSWEIIKSFSDSRIRSYRSDQNHGQAMNFNRALNLASGEYVKLLCADDILEEGVLEAQALFLEKHRHLSMVSCARKLIDSQGAVHRVVNWFPRPTIIGATGLRIATLIYGNIVGEPSAVLFRREAWLKTGPCLEGMATLIDLDFWLRMSAHGGIGFIPHPLCRIRRHKLSMTNHFQRAGEVQEVVLRMTEALLEELGANQLVRRVSLGKVAGSYLRHASYGLHRGLIKGAVLDLAAAFRVDPGLAGFLVYITLFRTGLLGLRVGDDGRASVCSTSTLRNVPEVA